MTSIHTSSSVMRRVLKLITAREKAFLLGVLAMNALVALLDVLTILILYDLIRGIIGVDASELSAGLTAAMIAVALLFLRGMFGSLCGFVFANWTERFLTRILDGIFFKYVTGGFNDLSENSHGTLIRDIQNAKFLLDGYFEPLFGLSREAVTGVGILIAMVAIDLHFSLVAFGLIACLGAVATRTISSRLSFFGAQRSESQAVINDLVTEALTGAKETRLYDASHYWVSRFSPHASRFSRSNSRFSFALLLPRYVFELVAVIGVGGASAVYWLSGNPVETIVAIVSAMGVATVRLAPSAAVVSASWQALKYYQPQVEGAVATIEGMRVPESSVFDGSKDLELLRKTRHSARAAQSLEIQPVFLDCTDLQFRRGETVVPRRPFSLRCGMTGLIALSGRSGAGKSTVIDGLLGFVEPIHGSISVNGSQVTSLGSSNCRVGLVEQIPFILSGTVRENLWFGLAEKPTDGKLLASLEAVDLATEFPLDRLISNRNESLSGGQSYRLAIARSIVRECDVLILDEPTSALDSVSSHGIRLLLRSEASKRLVIVVTHDQELSALSDQEVSL